LTFAVSGSGPSNGALGTFTSTGATSVTVAYTPNSNFNGEDSFNFVVNDGTENSDAVAVSLTIDPIDDAPELFELTRSIQVIEGPMVIEKNEGERFYFNIKAADPDFRPVHTYTIEHDIEGDSQPIMNSFHGVFEKNLGIFSWYPNFEQAGSYDVKFTVTDDQSLSDSKIVTLVVNNFNRQPSFSQDVVNFEIDETETISHIVSATDADGQDLVYTHSELPPGSIYDSETNTFTFETDHDTTHEAQRQFQITFTANDNDPDDPKQASQTLNIVVNNVNRVPIIDSIGEFTDLTQDILFEKNEGELLEFDGSSE